jgi:hypothetical protein
MEEIMMSKQVGKGSSLVRGHLEAAHRLTAEQTKAGVDGDGNNGTIFMRPHRLGIDNSAVRKIIVLIPRNQSNGEFIAGQFSITSTFQLHIPAWFAG